MSYMEKKGFESAFHECVGMDEVGKIVVSDERQAFFPKNEEYNVAIAELCNEVGRKLYSYPLWKKKLLQLLLQDFGANPDQVIDPMIIPINHTKP